MKTLRELFTRFLVVLYTSFVKNDLKKYKEIGYSSVFKTLEPIANEVFHRIAKKNGFIISIYNAGDTQFFLLSNRENYGGNYGIS